MGEVISHTPGPWRWQLNAMARRVQLCGGSPRFDLIVMDFERWGMQGAVPRLRNHRDLMVRADFWAADVPGREHHSSWHQAIDHPDMRLIEAAPDFEEGMAYFIMLSCRLGAEIPDEIVEWSRSILAGKNRNGIDVARAAIVGSKGALQ
jgi:hypothetical protein